MSVCVCALYVYDNYTGVPISIDGLGLVPYLLIRGLCTNSNYSWNATLLCCNLSVVCCNQFCAVYVTGVTTASSGTASSGTSARHSSDTRV